jgi:hypothetical protein
MHICGNNTFLQLSDLLLDFYGMFFIQPVLLLPYLSVMVCGPLRFLGQWLGGFASVGQTILEFLFNSAVDDSTRNRRKYVNMYTVVSFPSDTNHRSFVPAS